MTLPNASLSGFLGQLLVAARIEDASERAAALQLELDGLDARRTEILGQLASLGFTERAASATAAALGAGVLVVHRDEAHRQAAAMALAAAGHEVRTAIDGRGALLRLSEGAADLVIAEAAMTDLTAFELVAAMQQRPAVEHVPLILLGPAEGRGDVALALGRVPYVAGFDPAELVARVRSTLASAATPLPAEPVVPVLSPPAFDRACRRELLRSAGPKAARCSRSCGSSSATASGASSVRARTGSCPASWAWS